MVMNQEKNKICCPCCGVPLAIKPHVVDNRISIFVAENDDENLTAIIKSLLNFWRWCTEGKIPYYRSTTKDKKQYYYDSYHNGISYDGETETYSFRIQVSDSPMGDTWIVGTFMFDGPSIKITKLESEHI